ncbi:PDDEXK-like family protein [Bartonella sp. HY761]|uniref:PDDEXK-like family protein n=1 Tax=Bartonella sp. HY761 TaxID=2979330 RepID=UPI0021FDF951|nr:PD-(D/E)XK nuclease family protein [Bartonella sp. HY761]UXN06599.1 PD-(D/E)XK nuclease family protein [Bartonella sp. HY761]
MSTLVNEQSISDSELTNLFINNEIFDKITNYLGRFNPIKVMRMEGMEIRHSAILAWLLDPKESHGLGDNFLKAFLAEALRENKLTSSINAFQIKKADLRDAQVRREWHHIDIFIVSPQNNWAFIIENKFFSKQYNGQLKKYKNNIIELFQAQKSIKNNSQEPILSGIFLTLYEEAPEDNTYTSIRYEQIVCFLRFYIEQEHYWMSNEVTTFLKHYIEIIEEAAGMNTDEIEMQALARQLYRDHKKTIDFIVEHGSTTNFLNAVCELVKSHPVTFNEYKIEETSYIAGYIQANMFSFLPKAWYTNTNDDSILKKGCEQWWMGYPLIVWLRLWPHDDAENGTLSLYAEVGPINNYDARLNLIEKIENIGSKNIAFQKKAKEKGTLYSKFLKNNSISIKDIYDTDELNKGITNLLNRFTNDFEKIGEILHEIRTSNISNK